MTEEEKKKEIIFKFLRYKDSTGSQDLEISSEIQWKPITIKKYMAEETGSVDEWFKSIEEQFTGNIEDKSTKIITYPFERYIVSIELTPQNGFIRITEITLNKDFRSLQEKIRTDKVFDLDELDLEG